MGRFLICNHRSSFGQVPHVKFLKCPFLSLLWAVPILTSSCSDFGRFLLWGSSKGSSSFGSSYCDRRPGLILYRQLRIFIWGGLLKLEGSPHYHPFHGMHVCPCLVKGGRNSQGDDSERAARRAPPWRRRRQHGLAS